MQLHAGLSNDLLYTNLWHWKITWNQQQTMTVYTNWKLLRMFLQSAAEGDSINKNPS